MVMHSRRGRGVKDSSRRAIARRSGFYRSRPFTPPPHEREPRDPLLELTGHTILITGGATGIGLALAQKFVELGNEVIFTGRRQNQLDEARAATPKLHTIASDVGDVASIQRLAAEVRTRFPKLDVLINNAGIFVTVDLGKPAADLTALTSEVDINLNGPIRLTSALLDVLLANKGTVINVSSGLAWVPLPSSPIYSATKAALHAYTASLRLQLADLGVRVIEVLPPTVKTELAAVPEGVQAISTAKFVEATIRARPRSTSVRPASFASCRAWRRASSSTSSGRPRAPCSTADARSYPSAGTIARYTAS